MSSFGINPRYCQIGGAFIRSAAHKAHFAIVRVVIMIVLEMAAGAL